MISKVLLAINTLLTVDDKILLLHTGKDNLVCQNYFN